jgi:hypothetical protein
MTSSDSSWIPDELVNLSEDEQQAIIDEASEQSLAYDCDVKNTCTSSQRMTAVKGLLLLELTHYKETREQFVDRFLGKMAEICSGSRYDKSKHPKATSAYFQTKAAKYESSHANDFCVPAKWSAMLYDESKPIMDVLMMMPWRFLAALGL